MTLPGYLLRRLAAAALLLWLVLTATFVLLRLVPGDPAAMVSELPIPRQQKIIIIHTYGWDRPLPEQYVRWLGAVVLHGDWGFSFAQLRPVSTVVAEALPATLLLAAAALLIEYGVGTALGVAAARHGGSALDKSIRVVTLLLYSQPVFWLGLMAVLVFSYWLGWLPASHMQSVGADEMGRGAQLADLGKHLVLPAMTLGLAQAGGAARFVRASLLDVMGRDYIRTARAKGLPERRVIWVHGMRGALVPVIQLLALSVTGLLSGALITEVVFAWPGLGRVTYDAILARDSPVLLATTAISAVLVVGCNLVADLLHAAADPRVRDA
ncbi:MAG TPA: ABC transporter permease [Thermoanaerobaculia bacterium]|nr:ABC transporter permease [Thermoanaerobaculia bacterium]